MLASASLIAFVPTTDLDRARAFYADVLGLPLTEDTPFAAVFRAGPTMLRVTPVGEVPARPYTVLGWAVDDLAGTVRDLTRAGVEFNRYEGMEQDSAGVWAAPGGDLVAWFADPDGNTLSLTQLTAP